MPYRGAHKTRTFEQSNSIASQAGQTAMWRQWISAVSGNQAAGFGKQDYYRQQTITALFANIGVNQNLQQQQAGGMLEAGMIQISTEQKLSAADEIVWNSIRYRVDTVSQPSTLNQRYVSVLKRGDK